MFELGASHTKLDYDCAICEMHSPGATSTAELPILMPPGHGITYFHLLVEMVQEHCIAADLA
jgi:hypothetical protein